MLTAITDFYAQDLEKAREKQRSLHTQLKELQHVKEISDKLLDDLDKQKIKLEEAKAKNEAILASIGDGVVATDDAELVMFINSPAERMLGVQARKIFGKRWSDIQAVENEQGIRIPRNQRLIYRVLRSRVTKTSSREQTHYYVRGDGTRFPVSVTVSPVLLKRKIIGAIEVFRDITEEKTIDRAKSEFVSIASHQLYTPLSLIRWYTEVLLDGSAGKVPIKQLKLIEIISQVAYRMTDLVSTLLDVSRIELGTFTVDSHPTHLSELVDAARDELAVQSQARNIKVETLYDATLPPVNVDPKLMRVVFDNLLSNAIKYTPPRGLVRFQIALGAGEYANNVFVTVSDSGCGIPKNEQSKIFTKLFRASNAIKNAVDGTGLGLYIVKAIIERFDGKIWFESEENKGTTFYITIPIKGVKQKSAARH